MLGSREWGESPKNMKSKFCFVTMITLWNLDTDREDSQTIDSLFDCLVQKLGWPLKLPLLLLVIISGIEMKLQLAVFVPI